MIYRILVALIAVLFIGVFLILTASWFFPSIINVEIIVTAGIYFLPLILIFYIIFKIQKARHPENFIPPASIDETRENVRRYGVFAFAREIFAKDKNLLVKVEDKTSPEQTKNTIKAYIIVMSSMVVLMILILSIYLFLVNLQKNNRAGYNNFSIFMNKVTNTAFYKFIDRISNNSYKRNFHRY